MIISNKQLEAIRAIGEAEFELKMVNHIKEFSPLHANTVSEERLVEFVRLARKNAGLYGFTNIGPVRFFIELMIMLGAFFKTPQYPWVNVVLNDNQFYKNQTQKADQLHNLFLDYFDKVVGAKGEYALNALIQLKKNKNELEHLQYQGDKSSTDALIEAIKSIYPEKADFLGKGLLEDLIKRAYKKATNYNIDSNQGINLFIGLMLSIGHNFDRDPMYPWIHDTLRKEESILAPNDKANTLYRKIQMYVMQTLKNLS